MNPRQFPAWCQDCREIARLLRFVNEQERLDVKDAIAIVEKPWHWDLEYQAMCEEQADRDRRQTRLELAKCDDILSGDGTPVAPLLEASLALAKGGRR